MRTLILLLLLFLGLTAQSDDLVVKHTKLGKDLYKQGRYEEAIQQYRVALQLDPNYRIARMNLGLALMSKGEHPAAEAEFERILKVDSTHAFTHYNLGCARALQDKKDGAVRSLHRAFLLDRRLIETAKIDKDLLGLREEETYKSLLKVFEIEND